MRRRLRGLSPLVLQPAAIVLLIAVAGYAADPGSDDACALCDRNDLPQGLCIRPASAESLGAVYAARNLDAIHRAGNACRIQEGVGIDERLLERASALFQLQAWDGIRLIAELAGSPREYVTIGHGDALGPLRDHYANVAVYPLRFVQRAQLGDGMFCLQYDIPSQYDERIKLGKATLKTAAEVVGLSGRGKVPVLLREYALAEGDKLGLLFESTVCGRTSAKRIEDRGDSLELVMLYDLRGIYVRKAGIHALGALMVWRSLLAGDDLPENPRLGACAYFPKLTFSLPLLLPDLGLDDLRDFAYPQPVVPKKWFYYPNRYLPSWVNATAAEVFTPWRSRGPRPLILSELFPDL